MFTLSQNIPFLAFFHLTTHAIFKALLFISVGLSIIISHHQQNTYHKRINTRNRINSTFIIIAILSLTAIPFIGAFLSKDPILEITIYNPPHLLPTLIVMLGATLTVSYRIRLFRSSIYKHSTSIINHTSTFPQCHIDAVLLPLILQSLASVIVPPTFLLTYSYFLPPINLPPSDHFTPLLIIVLGYLLVDSKSKLNLILPTRPTSQYVSPSQTTSHTLFLTSSFPKILHPPSFKFSLTSLQLIDNG